MKNSNVLGTLRVLRDGKALTVADHFLSRCAMAVCVCGAKNPKARGKFTISLALKPSVSGGGNAVTIRYCIQHDSPTNTGKETETTEGEEVMLVSADGAINHAEAPSMGLFSVPENDEDVAAGEAEDRGA